MILVKENGINTNLVLFSNKPFFKYHLFSIANFKCTPLQPYTMIYNLLSECWYTDYLNSFIK